MKRLYSTLLFLFLLTNALQAQDPAFSQLFNSRMYLNPAFTGIDQGHRLSVASRTLWRNLPSNFNTHAVSYDYQPCAFPRIGLGFIGVTDSEGEGKLKSTEMGAVFAFHTPYSLSRRRKDKSAGSFSFSLQASYITRNIDWNKLVFGDQVDPVLGVVSPRTTQATINYDGTRSPDFATGFLWRQRMYVNKRWDMTFHLGFAMHHIFKPYVGLLENGVMPRKYTVHTGLLIPLSKTSFLIPSLRYMNQDVVQIHSIFDANMMYLNKKVFGGLSYRFNQFIDYLKNTDAIMFFAGYEFDMSREADLRLTYSFDTNFKGVSGGNFYTHEISIVFVYAGKCNTKIGLMNKNICDYEGKGLPKIF